MAISKVTLNGTTLMDVTGNTSVAGNMYKGVIGVSAAGESVTGVVPYWVEEDVTTAGSVTKALDPFVLYHFTGALTDLTITLNSIVKPLYILTDGTAWSASLGEHYAIPVANVKSVYLETGSLATAYTFLKADDSVGGGSVNYATGWSRTVLAGNSNVTLTVPSDATILYIQKKLSADTDYTPSRIELDGVPYTSTYMERYHFDFDSGATAPTLTLPNTIIMPESFAVDGSKHYEIDILNTYGAAISWAIS